MFRDFLAFMWAFWRQLVPLVTGGSLMAGLGPWGWATHQQIKPDWYWILIGLTFILASFAAWRQEWIANKRGLIEVDLKSLARLRPGGYGTCASILRQTY
jgi:uncharacterized membrane protein YfcA